MNVTREVILDLLPAYLSGEASRETCVLVDAFRAKDPEIDRTIREETEQLKGESPMSIRPDAERESLLRTQSMLRFRTVTMALATAFSLFPVSFYAHDNQVDFLWELSPQIAAASALGAIGFWIAYLVARHQMRVTQI